MNNSEYAPPKVADSTNTKGPMETYDNEDDDKGSDEVASPTFVEQAKEDHVGNLPSCPQPIENDGKNRSFQSSNALVNNISQEKYDQRVAQVVFHIAYDFVPFCFIKTTFCTIICMTL